MADYQVASDLLQQSRQAFHGQKSLAERALAQLDDAAFFAQLDDESNSVAIIVKHVGGNLRSRWTDFLSSDGEKPDRRRDSEFVIEPGDSRQSLMNRWEDGWRTVFDTLDALAPDDLEVTVYIRGEAVSAVAALQRSLAHISHHVGQVVFVAKHLRSADWMTLSIARGKSAEYRPPQVGRVT